MEEKKKRKKRATIFQTKRVLKYWDYERNKGLDPKKITCGSEIKVYWKCENGHSWESKVNTKASKYSLPCPFCDRKKNTGRRELVFQNRKLMKCWDYEKNKEISPKSITACSCKEVYWKCPNGHSWKDTVRNKSRKGALLCPFCAGITKKAERITIDKIEKVIKYWDYEKNVGLDPTKIYKNSNLEVYWKCENGHSWKSKIKTKSDSGALGCIYCDRKTPIITKEKELLRYWDFEKNQELNPHYMTCASNKEVYWKCKKGHSWSMPPNHMWNGRKIHCPICEKNIVSKEYNLKTEYPKVVMLYDKEKNKIPVESIAPKTKMEVYWRCKKGHSWKNKVQNQINIKGCPYCEHSKTSEEYNLFALYPDLCKEWDYEKNKDIDIKKVFPQSGKKVYWKCENGHSWKAQISTRVNNNSHCPECYKFYKSSFSEQVIYYYIKQIFKDAISRYKYKNKHEIDIFIPSINLGIEYDGCYYHRNLEREIAKNKFLESEKVHLIRVKEMKKNIEEKQKDNIIYCKYDYKYDFMKEVIAEIFQIINNKYGKKLKISVDVLRDRYKIWDIFLNVQKQNNLLTTHPKLVEEWDYEKNGILIPEMFTHGSMQLISWKCNKGHTFEATINNRAHTKKGRKCPYCANFKVNDENSLKNIAPELAKEWDYEKNEKKPEEVLYRTSKIYYWKCDKGHSWKARVSDRYRGSRCPFCYHNRITYEKSFAYKYPLLLKEWDYEKNKGINPEKIGDTYTGKVWWICNNKHSFQFSVQYRVRRRTCPKCNEDKIREELKRRTSLDFLESQWDMEKNQEKFIEKNLLPHHYYYWKCEKNHMWKETWEKRKKGRECPYCRGRKLSKDNTLAVVYPQLLIKWNKERNLPLTPYNITSKYSKNIWWKCEKNHIWKRKVKDQLKNDKCPYCTHRLPSLEYNFAVLYPEIAREWEVNMNHNLKPTQILPKSSLKYYWKCQKGHIWQATPSNRSRGRGCPICYKESRMEQT